MGDGVEGLHEGEPLGGAGASRPAQGAGASGGSERTQEGGGGAGGGDVAMTEAQPPPTGNPAGAGEGPAAQGGAQAAAAQADRSRASAAGEGEARLAQHLAGTLTSQLTATPTTTPAPARTPHQTAPSPVPTAASAHTPMSAEPTQGESPSLTGSGGTTRSRYGRKTAVTNFARLLDPMSRSNSPSSDVAKEIKSPPQHGPEDAHASSMVEAVRALVYKVGAPSAIIAAAAVNPHSDKYIGVRNKQSGFGAVIKKNHSEINLGIYETAEEAARAYDMAALFCQGDRAKLNFSDSLDLYDNHYTPELKLPVTPMRDKDVFAMSFHGAAAHPRLAGGLLTDLADRLPYSAVRCGDSSVWEEFSAKNDSLESWQAFGAQLVWLLKHQIVEEVLSDEWREGPMAAWEAACLTCGSGDAAAKVMQEAEQQGIDWNKVGGMWDAEGVTEGVTGMSRTRAAVRHGSFAGRTPLASSSAINSPSLAGRDKRRRDAYEDGSLEGSLDVISDFARINGHIVSAQPSDASLCFDGLGSTLDVIRAQKKAQRVHAAAQAAAQEAKREQMLQQLARSEAPLTPTQMPRESANRPERSLAGRGPFLGASDLPMKTAKGLTCRYCGKGFTHAPAHLQHERAHVQQQETMNPASRIYHHMPATAGSPRISRDSSRLDPCLQDSRARASRSPGLMSAEQPQTVPIKPRQVSKYLLDLASRLPAEVSSLADLAAWEQWGVMTTESETLQQVCDQMDWLAARIDRRVTPMSWTEASKAMWKGECEGCDSAAELMDLAQRFEREALNWALVDELNHQPKLIGMKQTFSKLLSSGVSSQPVTGLCDEQVLALAESMGNGDKAKAVAAPAEGVVDSAPAACVESGVPCGVCSSQNKGIAACFAQGHLFVVEKGGLPSSCKDCKQRNKGALFCFKRGHMHNLVPVLSAGAPGVKKEGESSDSGEDVVLR